MWKSHMSKISYGNLRIIIYNSVFYFETLVLASYCYCLDNASNAEIFQNMCFKGSNNMAVKQQ